MPIPTKKSKPGGGCGGAALARLFSSLRPPDRGGSLVVQTGFPTSLADLVVQNRGRLKKPSRGRKKRSSSPQTPDPAASTPHAVARSTTPGVHAPVPVPERIAEETASVPPNSSEIRRKGAAFGLGLELLIAANLVILVLLALGGHRLIVGMTLSVFALLLLDSVKLGVFQWLKPCPEARPILNSEVGGLYFRGRGFVSPIREAEIVPLSCSTISDISVHSTCSDKCFKEPMGSEHGPGVLPERNEAHEIDSGSSEPRPLFKRLFSKKTRGKRKSKDGKVISPDSSRRRGLDSQHDPEAIGGEEDAEVGEAGDESVRSFSLNAETAQLITKERNFELKREISHGTTSNLGKSRLLAFFALVLLGLVGGKAAALVVAVSCCLSVYRYSQKLVDEPKHPRK